MALTEGLLKVEEEEEEDPGAPAASNARKNAVVREAGLQLRLAAPMAAVGLLQYLLTMVSLSFAGHIGKLELASASLANSITNLIGYYVMIGMGSALETLCGQAYGANQHHMLGVYLQRAVLVLCLTCLPLSAIYIFMEPLLLAIGQEADIARGAGRYAIWLLPRLYASAFLQPMIRFFLAQSVVLPMAAISAVTLALHFPLCWFIMYKLKFGFEGAALSTSLSFWLTLVLLLLYAKLSNAFKDTWKGFSREALCNVRQFLKLALSSAVMICLEYWAFEILVLLSGLLPRPKLELSALSICLSIATLNYMIPYGLSAAVSTRVSNELGAGRTQAARLAVYVVLGLALAASTLIAAVLLLARHTWGSAFTNDKQVVEYVAILLPFNAIAVIMDSTQNVLAGVVRGCGRQHLGAAINLVAFYGFGMPAGIIAAFVFKLGGTGIWAGFLTGYLVQDSVLIFAILRTDFKKQAELAARRLYTEEEADVKKRHNGYDPSEVVNCSASV